MTIEKEKKEGNVKEKGRKKKEEKKGWKKKDKVKTVI
jgi:hypothetical protein